MNRRPAVSLQIIGLLAWLLVCFITAAIGAAASVDAGSFYAQLSRPTWAPPAGLFAPVWTTLYALMGLSAWLVWREHRVKPVLTALALFVLQLVANALWSWLFFEWKLGALAFAEVLLLWLLIAATALWFLRIRALAAVLLLPYLAWVTFAAALTYSTWQRNPGLL